MVFKQKIIGLMIVCQVFAVCAQSLNLPVLEGDTQDEVFIEYGGGYVYDYYNGLAKNRGMDIGTEWTQDDAYPKLYFEFESLNVWQGIKQLIHDQNNAYDIVLDRVEKTLNERLAKPEKNYFKGIVRWDVLAMSDALLAYQFLPKDASRDELEKMNEKMNQIDHEFLLGFMHNLKTFSHAKTDVFPAKDESGAYNVVSKLNQIEIGMGIFLKAKNKPSAEEGLFNTLYPALRFEIAYSKTTSNFIAQKSVKKTGKVYALAEINLIPTMLKKAFNELAEVVYYLDIPGADVMIDITDQISSIVPEAWLEQVENLSPSNTKTRIALDTEQASQQIYNWVENKISPNLLQNAETMAMLMASYAPYVGNAIYGVQFLNWLRQVMFLSNYKSVVTTSGKAFAVGDMLIAGTDMLTDPYTIELMVKGAASTRAKIYAALENEELEVYEDNLDEWVHKDPYMTYPILLEILQAASKDKNLSANGRQEALDIIAKSNLLLYMHELETFVKEQGFTPGVMFTSAGDIAEELFQRAEPTQRARVLSVLNKRFGLLRTSHDLNEQASWWITATEVDSESDQAVIKSQRRILDALANLLRSEIRYQQILQDRKTAVVGQMTQDLGISLTPEIINTALKRATK